MANSYFRFRQFTVHQDRSAMKVCTDSCILGAFAARLGRRMAPSRILDMGTGTGLLALMLAQVVPAEIDGVELDPAAMAQAGENFLQSPWAARLHALEADIRTMSLLKPYTFIIINPPFFENSLKSRRKLISQARHNETLHLEDLVPAIARHLAPGGTFCLMLPPGVMTRFRGLAEAAGWHPRRLLAIHSRPGAEPHAVVGHFSTGPSARRTEKLFIMGEGGNYTPGFRSLLHPYYPGC